MGTFTRFKAWQACFDLTTEIYRVTTSWPSGERYGLTAQLRRAVVSAGANIAEGSARQGSPEFRRFLDYAAVGSLAQVNHLLLVARALGYLDEDSWARSEATRVTGARLVAGLKRSLVGGRVPRRLKSNA